MDAQVLIILNVCVVGILNKSLNGKYAIKYLNTIFDSIFDRFQLSENFSFRNDNGSHCNSGLYYHWLSLNKPATIK